jgi:RND family efflux transporter MFP subunit
MVLLAFGVAVLGIRLYRGHALAVEAAEHQKSERAVTVVTVGEATGGTRLTLPGQSAAWYEATLDSRVNGYVGSWHADIGDRVKKGQVLATLETPELDAELAAAGAQLKVAEAQVEFAKSTYERWKESPQGVVSDQEREAKKADYHAADAQLALAKARVAQYSSLSEFKKVVAPFDGRIVERRIDIGNLVTAGSTNATTPLYQIAQDDPVRVYVEVPQSVAADIARASRVATVLVDDGGSTSIEAQIARIAGAIHPVARTMRLEIDVPNGDGKLLPGMYLHVAFSLTAKGRAQVPASAIVFRSDGPHVANVGTDGRVSFPKVEIGRDDGSSVELVSGVAPGDQVVVNVNSQLADGDHVKIQAASGQHGAALPAK